MTVVSLIFMRFINVFQGWSVAIFVVCMGMAIVAIAMQVRRYRLGCGLDPGRTRPPDPVGGHLPYLLGVPHRGAEHRLGDQDQPALKLPATRPHYLPPDHHTGTLPAQAARLPDRRARPNSRSSL
jgi:hypothetical protein